MKNIFKTLAAVALIALAASCSKDAAEAPAVNGDAQVTFSVELPGVVSRATNDGTTAVDLYCAVYSNDPQAQTPLFVKTAQMQDRKATISMELVADQIYDLVFWAQSPYSGYTLDWAAKQINLNYTNPEDGSVEDRDAFIYIWHDLEVKGSINQPVKLVRPFAQINVGLSEGQLTKAANAGFDLAQVQVAAKTYNAISVAEGQGVPAGNQIDVVFKATANKSDIMTINNKDYNWVSFNYVLPNAAQSELQDIKIDFYSTANAQINVPKFTNVPVERNHRTNILGDLLTDPAKFEVVILPGFEDEHNIDTIVSVEASTNEEIEEALNSNAEYITINMAADLTVDVTAWATMAFGGDKTKSVTINGDGHTLTFNLKNSDWSHVVMANAEGKLILNDVKIASSGYNTGHWKRTIVHFASEMELNNVTAAQGLGFKKDAKLNNVTINVTNDNYAFWVWAEGQTIDIDGLTIASEGRAIKVGDEDATGTAVTLNIANSTFATQKKAAVLVSSKGGATINWGAGNDISQVAQDKVFAVWVDEDWAQHDAKVIVNGCHKKIEGTGVVGASSVAELNAALADGASEVMLSATTYDMTQIAWNGNAVTLNGVDGTVLNTTNAPKYVHTSGNITFNNVKIVIKSDGEYYDRGIVNAGKNIYNECDFEGIATNYGVCVYNDCTFTNNTRGKYAAWVYSGNASYNGCEFYGVDRAAKVYTEAGNTATAAYNDCKFVAQTANKTAVEIDSSNNNGKNIYYTVTFVNPTIQNMGQPEHYGTQYFNMEGNSVMVIYEGKTYVKGNAAATAAISKGGEVVMGPGAYSMPSIGKDVTISGEADAVITINKPNLTGSSVVTLNGVTVKGSGYSTGMQHCNKVIYNNVKVIGEMCLYGNEVQFNECDFELAGGQYIWTYGAAKASFVGCDFQTDGKALLIYNEGTGASDVTVSGCKFYATAGAKAGAIANQNCAAIEIDNFQSSGTGAAHKLTTSGNTYEGGAKFSGEWRIKNYVAGAPVTVNGVEYTQIAIDGKLMTKNAQNEVTVL